MPINDDVLAAMDGEPVRQSFPVMLMFDLLQTIRSRITVDGSSVGVSIGPDNVGAYVEKFSGFRGPDIKLMKSVGTLQDVVISFGLSDTRSGFPVQAWVLGMSDNCHDRRELLSFMRRCLRTPGVSLQLMLGLVEGDGVTMIRRPVDEVPQESAVNEPQAYVSGGAPVRPRMIDW